MLRSDSEEEETGSQAVLGCSQAISQSLSPIPIPPPVTEGQRASRRDQRRMDRVGEENVGEPEEHVGEPKENVGEPSGGF